MTGRVWVPALALALIVSAAPAASAQDTTDEEIRQKILATPGQDVTFYGHLFGHRRDQPQPMNTQFPLNEDDYSLGSFGSCGTLNGVPLHATTPYSMQADPTLDEGCDRWAGNEAWFYSTAGFVQVKNRIEWGGDYTKFHNERGLTKDVYIDTSRPAQGTFYMSADFHGWSTAFCDLVVYSQCWNWDPGQYQDWVVEATIYHGSLGEYGTAASEEPSMEPTYNGEVGKKIGTGRVGPMDFVSMDSTVPVVGGKTVHPFHVNVTWEQEFIDNQGRIPYTDSIMVRWEWYQETGSDKYIVAPGDVAITFAWNINAGEDYPPKMVIPVRNPLDVELVYPQFIHDKLVVLSVINTPWGSYDLDPELIKLIFKDEEGNVVEAREDTIFQILEQSVAHQGHYLPIKPTWVWDFQAQGLEPGKYTATVEVTNFQHSVTTSTTAGFEITKDGGGSTTEGRSGFQTLKGDIHAGHQGTAADPNSTGAITQTITETYTTKGVPMVGAPLVAAAVAVAVAVSRRRSA